MSHETVVDNCDALSHSTHHGAVDLAEAGCAKDVEQQLLLDACSHPQEELQPCLKQVDSALGQPLLRVPHSQWQRAALQLHLQERTPHVSYSAICWQYRTLHFQPLVLHLVGQAWAKLRPRFFFFFKTHWACYSSPPVLKKLS